MKLESRLCETPRKPNLNLTYMPNNNGTPPPHDMIAREKSPRKYLRFGISLRSVCKVSTLNIIIIIIRSLAFGL